MNFQGSFGQGQQQQPAVQRDPQQGSTPIDFGGVTMRQNVNDGDWGNSPWQPKFPFQMQQPGDMQAQPYQPPTNSTPSINGGQLPGSTPTSPVGQQPPAASDPVPGGWGHGGWSHTEPWQGSQGQWGGGGLLQQLIQRMMAQQGGGGMQPQNHSFMGLGQWASSIPGFQPKPNANTNFNSWTTMIDGNGPQPGSAYNLSPNMAQMLGVPASGTIPSNYQPPQPGQMVSNGWGGMMPFNPNQNFAT